LNHARRPTLQSLASRVGISTAAVSKALAGKADISEATRALVLAEAQRQGYVLNHAAGMLRTGRSHTVTAIFDRLNPMAAEIAEGLDEVLAAAHLRLAICSARGYFHLEEESFAWAARTQSEGIVLSSMLPVERMVQVYGRASTPLVLLNRPEADLPGAAHASIDETSGAADAVRHLVEFGHRRIGVIARAEFNAQKIAGAYKGAGRSAQIEVLDLRDAQEETIRQLIAPQLARNNARRCTALLCSGDLVAMLVMALAGKAGLACPRDLSIVGFDDLVFAEHTSPGLSTVHVPQRELGRAAGELLLAIQKPRRKRPALHRKIDCRFVARGSSGPAPKLS
jgi:LacI family repressor for deo operon, udp, cdd, tsx, nupC, and nupG